MAWRGFRTFSVKVVNDRSCEVDEDGVGRAVSFAMGDFDVGNGGGSNRMNCFSTDE